MWSDLVKPVRTFRLPCGGRAAAPIGSWGGLRGAAFPFQLALFLCTHVIGGGLRPSHRSVWIARRRVCSKRRGELPRNFGWC